MGNPIHGFNGYLYAGITTAVPVGELTEYSLDMDPDIQEVTSLGQTWKTKVKGPMGWSGSASGNFDTVSSGLWTMATSMTIAQIYLYPDRASTTRYYYGTAWIKLPKVIAGGVKAASKVSLSLDGSGPLAAN